MKTINKIRSTKHRLKNKLNLGFFLVAVLLSTTSCSDKNYGCYDFGYEYQDSDNRADLSEQGCIIEPSKASQSCVEH